MPDVYATIADTEPEVLAQLAEVLELRAADPRQRAMRESYLADLPLGAGSRVLEVGCGTGAVTRAIAARAGDAVVVGVDPSPAFVAKARELSETEASPTFDIGDGRDLPYTDGSFDVVVFHTTLCHIPGPEQALVEARRVLTSAGRLAVFDGDYATTTVATGDPDPLQATIDAAVGFLVHDKWLVRRLPRLVTDAGFDVIGSDSFGYIETSEPSYMLTLVDRGADLLVAGGRIGPDLAEALKAEARRRVSAGGFFGHIAYGVVHATRP